MKSVTNPLDEGRRMLEAGDLPSAVLCFEVAAQQVPDNPLAWQLLGTTQAENERVTSSVSISCVVFLVSEGNLKISIWQIGIFSYIGCMIILGVAI